MRFLLFAVGLVLFGPPAFGFDYFNSKIDYWNNAEPVEPQKKPDVESKSDSKPKESFDWKKHTDPKNDEFFREGDYIPPKPFMELVRDPSDVNIKQWFAYIEKKNELSDRLQFRIQEYVKKNNSKLNDPELTILKNKTAKVEPQSTLDPKRYRFRLYFHSSCPHCKRMMATMLRLRDSGFFVEIVQVDHDKSVLKNIPFPIRNASREELQQKGIRSWPVLLVGDLAKKVVYRINGYQTPQKVLDIIRSKA